jgi:negative regulator of flagellin synthesis FlgM
MNINHINRMGPTNPYYRQQEAKRVDKTADRLSRADEVSISQQAKELAAVDPMRKERIEQLKQSVNAGTYHVDARLIAEKLLRYFKL